MKDNAHDADKYKSYVQFEPPSTYSLKEAVGSHRVGVARTGDLSLQMHVSVADRPISAQRGLDYFVSTMSDGSSSGDDDTGGQLSWAAGEGGTKYILVTIIDDGVGNEWNVELFQLVLFDPSLIGEVSGQRKACVGRSASADIRIVEDAISKAAMEHAAGVVEVIMRVGVDGASNASSISQGSIKGERFEQALKESFAIALGVSPAVVWEVKSTDSPATKMDRAPNGPCDASAPPPCALVVVQVDVTVDASASSSGRSGRSGVSAQQLSSSLMSQLRNASSVLQRELSRRGIHTDSLFTPQLTIHLDIPPSKDGAATALVVVEVVVPVLLLLIAGCFSMCYCKRKKLSEYLLWRLASFRFTTLLERNSDQSSETIRAGVEMAGMTVANPVGDRKHQSGSTSSFDGAITAQRAQKSLSEQGAPMGGIDGAISAQRTTKSLAEQGRGPLTASSSRTDSVDQLCTPPGSDDEADGSHAPTIRGKDAKKQPPKMEQQQQVQQHAQQPGSSTGIDQQVDYNEI
jgi:hypothetical protein